MINSLIEKTMNLMLSLLMVTLFVLLAPFWTMFYGGVLLKDYLGMAGA